MANDIIPDIILSPAGLQFLVVSCEAICMYYLSLF